MTKTLIVGLDGATWDIIKPLAEEGKLPTFKKLMEEGVWGNLESTIPPITGPAWLSLATGMNLGKTGVFDFLSRKDSTYNPHPASSRDFQGKAIWDYVSCVGGKKEGIVNYPKLFIHYSSHFSNLPITYHSLPITHFIPPTAPVQDFYCDYWIYFFKAIKHLKA